MQLPWLATNSPFPPTDQAWPSYSEAPGLLAAGADLSVSRLVTAYRRGIFPWYSEGQPILWWSTDPRMVLATVDFKLHRSLRKTLQRFLQTRGCEIRFDGHFENVIQACATTLREGQRGTWILPEMVEAYVQLHHAGWAHSVETWVDGQLVGGLYGIRLGRMFFGESMFAHHSDASKLALCALVAWCQHHGIPWIDCQQQTRHLASLGATPVSRQAFETHLTTHVGATLDARWTYDPGIWTSLGLESPV